MQLPARILHSSFAAALAVGAAAQATVFSVDTNTEAALEAAIVAANARVFQTSAAQPVVIEFANGLIGQTIHLSHALPVLVVDHVTLRVAGASPTARVHIRATNAPTAFRVAGRHVVVENVRFDTTASPPTPPQDVFTAAGSENLTVRHCTFAGAGGNALWLIGVTAATIADCDFQGSAAGLVLTAGCSGISVANSRFTANVLGVLAAVADHLQITGCSFDANTFAVELAPVCGDVVFGPDNVVRNSSGHPAVVARGAVRLAVDDSQFFDNAGAGIGLLDLCADVTLRRNVFARNGGAAGHQVLVDGCFGVAIEGLQCSDGGAGVSARDTHLLRLSSPVGAPTSIVRNGKEGIVMNGCSDVVLDQIVVTDNVRTIAGAQVALIGCQLVDVTRSSITMATGPGDIGLRIADSVGIRVGLGTAVLDHGAQGILVGTSSDVLLGSWSSGPGSLSVRAPNAMQWIDSERVQLVGANGSPCSIVAGPSPSGIAFFVTGTDAARIGPFVAVDGAQAATTALQIADCGAADLDGVSIFGHTGWGLTASGSPGLRIRECAVDGGAGAVPANGEGLLLNPGCHGARLWGNLVHRQQGAAFLIRDCSDAWIGPGNRAIDNAGDGFAISDSQGGATTRRATVQSAVAIGRNLTSQVGFRFTHVDARATNLTATRNGTGVLLNVGARATLVNTISWGNVVDRNRDPGSSGSWYHGLLASSSGNGSPGSWSDTGMLVGPNPQFVAAASGDVRLASGSPAVDSGLHATPVGSGLPCVDAELQPRIRNAAIDRGAYERVPTFGTGNTLDLVGPWLRPATQSALTFSVRATPAQAGQYFLLLVSGSGTGPGLVAPGGSTVPLVADGYTSLLLSLPQWCLGVLDGAGVGTVTIPVTPQLVPYLPEVSFAAVVAGVGPATNPVVVRYLP